MRNDDRNDIAARANAIERGAAREVSLANTTAAQSFARLMQRQQCLHDEDHPSENNNETPNAGSFKQSLLHVVARMLVQDEIGNHGEHQDAGKERVHGTDEEISVDVAVGTDKSAGNGGGNTLQLEIEGGLIGSDFASELAGELAECIRYVDVSVDRWKLEIQLSVPQLSTMRLIINRDDKELNLRFVCTDSEARNTLETSSMLLLDRLGAVSVQPVAITIEEVSPDMREHT